MIVLLLFIPLGLTIFYCSIKNNEKVNNDIKITKNTVLILLDKKDKSDKDIIKLIFNLGRLQELLDIDKNIMYNTISLSMQTNLWSPVIKLLDRY